MTIPASASRTLFRQTRLSRQPRSISSSSKSPSKKTKKVEKPLKVEEEIEPSEIITSSPCRPLPLSPYMNATSTAAKIRPSKAKLYGPGTPLQQQLARNPYAQALATPMRRCLLTRTSIPRFFLQDFELVLHPTTNVPHFLPRSLAAPYGSRKLAHDANTPTQHVRNDDTDEVESTSSRPSENLANDSQLKEVHTASRGQRSYVLLRHLLIDRITRKPAKGQKNRYLHGHLKFAPDLFVATRQWRSDMADWVLELRRRRAAEFLSYLASLKTGYLIACGSEVISAWDDAKGKKQVGALLWLGKQTPRSTSAANSLQRSGEENKRLEMHSMPVQELSPPEFATLYLGRESQRKSKVPVHSLPDLLGQEKLSQLRDQYPRLFSAEIVAVKNRRMTIMLQMALWKLQGFLAQHEAMIEEQDADTVDEELPLEKS